jgi:hypothetical protein
MKDTELIRDKDATSDRGHHGLSEPGAISDEGLQALAERGYKGDATSDRGHRTCFPFWKGDIVSDKGH